MHGPTILLQIGAGAVGKGKQIEEFISPDLNLCNYFLWGYLKDRVYQNNPAVIDKLDVEILHEMFDFLTGAYELVVQNFVDQLE